MKLRSLLCSLLVVPCASMGADPQPPAPCSTEQYRQFDFWAGKWRVTNGDNVAGDSEIQPILGGCALLENWTGAQGGSGKSLNFYDRTDGLWHQTWIDANGGTLYLSGTFDKGAMRLQGTRPASAKRPALRHRITWTAQPGGSVRQLWESSPVDKEEWKVQFDGLYEPVGR